MKKILLVIGLILVALSAQAVNVAEWSYVPDLGAGYTQGWLVQMYQDVNDDSTLSSLVFDTSAADGTFTSAGNGSDDILLSVSTALADAKGSPPLNWAALNVDPGAAGTKVYTVIFNAVDIDNATQGRIVDSSTWNVVAETTYVQNSVNGSWQAVPEPATALLLALGGGLAWLVRMKQRMA